MQSGIFRLYILTKKILEAAQDAEWYFVKTWRGKLLGLGLDGQHGEPWHIIRGETGAKIELSYSKGKNRACVFFESTLILNFLNSYTLKISSYFCNNLGLYSMFSLII